MINEEIKAKEVRVIGVDGEAIGVMSSDDALKLTPPTIMSLEQCLEFIADDELVEVTPENIRMRKRILSKEQRMKQAFRKKQS